MNQTLDELCRRKSTRSFTDQKISVEDKQLILMAAAMAPTAGNQQLYTILDITDPVLRERLSETCDHQPFIAKAQMVLIFTADCKKWYDAYIEAGMTPREPGVGDFLLAVEDAVIAAQNAVTAAESLGIGSCYIGDIMENYEIHKELLSLPKYVFPAAMLVFGYPSPTIENIKKPKRVAQNFIVHENGYQAMNGQTLREMWRERCGEKGFDEYIRAFGLRKYESDFSREMTRSVMAAITEEFMQK